MFQIIYSMVILQLTDTSTGSFLGRAAITRTSSVSPGMLKISKATSEFFCLHTSAGTTGNVTSDLCGSFVQGEAWRCREYSQRLAVHLWSVLLKHNSKIHTEGNALNPRESMTKHKVCAVSLSHLCRCLPTSPLPQPPLDFQPGSELFWCSTGRLSAALGPPTSLGSEPR